MKILVACEESQEVTKAFRRKGHKAFSCDVQPCSGGFPEWHIKGDALKLINGNVFFFLTCDGGIHYIDKWDIIIAHPPCTYLTVSANRWFNVERYGEKAIQRHILREEAAGFFMAFVNANCERIAIENPIGVMSTLYRRPDQIIHPYMFGDPARKATCLWLKGLKPLDPTEIVDPVVIQYKNGKGTDSPWHMASLSLPPAERARARSKTFHGIAVAMASQCG